MDRETRNRIQRATQDARDLLEREYAEQLEGTFDIRLDGTVAGAPGAHLDARQRLVRRKLVTAIEHLSASGHGKDAVEAYLREAAFTTLNRFVALKMLEARGIVQECVSRGEESSGFKNEFTGLAPGLVQLPDHGYRLYIESLFDEIAREVRVLFDRRDPASLLWPRRQALLDLLAILNAAELASVWGEDETIGWVYQYFNSDEDRQRARYDEKGKPKAPRSSYELAVRNQFFTPRYVVQFLTDNTLGRIWYEMRRGDTRLRDLDYLVRRPNEVFLAEGEDVPTAADEGLTQEELLQRPVHVPFRAKKDPRDIRVLDPACGSGHFLLYAFDLLLVIYEEAWADEASPASEVTGETLREDYADLAALRAAMPGLILRHNLHGIDIDARCAQIAALALWMRAQRAYKHLGIGRDVRPPIQKTNIVVAEPMPGEPDLRREFIATLDPKLGQLVERVFDRMEIAGEAGSLLRIEDDIRDAVREIYGEHGQLFRASDEERWHQAEQDVLRALRAYAERATNGKAFQRRLFAEDAARGLGFIDLCRQRFHVILMNPPFGDPPPHATGCVKIEDCGNLYGAFVRRSKELGASVIGCIADRSFLTQASFKKLRSQFLECSPQLTALLDLGWGVLDANVQVAAFVLSDAQSGMCSCLDVRALGEDRALRSSAKTNSWRAVPIVAFERLPDHVIAYALPPSVLHAVQHFPALGDVAELPRGLGSNKAARTYLSWVEVPERSCEPDGRWRPLANGGEYSPYWRQDLGVADWLTPAGWPWVEMSSSDDWRPYDQSGSEAYFKAGLSFPKQSSSFNVAVLPSAFLPTREGKAILPREPDDRGFLLAYLNSRVVRAFVRDTCGLHKQSGAISRIPILPLSDSERQRISEAAEVVWKCLFTSYCYDETSRWFVGPASLFGNGAAQPTDLELQMAAIDSSVLDAMGLSSEDAWLDAPSIPSPYASRPSDTVSWAIGVAFGRFSADPVAEPVDLLSDALNAPTARSPAIERQSRNAATREILVDDSGHAADLPARIRNVYSVAFSPETTSEERWREDTQRLVGADGSIRDWLARAFFAEHIERYSISRRKAPIYWQLATPSASYSVWLYYHRFTRDTLYRVLNDYVTPKLKHEERKLASLTQDVGPNPSASQRKELDAQEGFVTELRAFQEEVARVAPLWNPDLNDGVIINFAPLWRLVPQNRSWQKECKKVWDKLVAGDYDWAHLAMHLWPERVVPKCAEDRSLAIAHDLEEVLWEEDEEGKWQPKKVGREVIARLVEERSSPAVKSALDDLIRAPAPTTTSRARRGGAGRGRAKTTRTPESPSASSTPSATVVNEANGAIEAVKQAIAASEDGTSKSDIVEATGISSTEWNAAINALLAQGVVTKTGAARGTRYHLAEEDEHA